MPNAAATPVAPNSVTRQANVLISEVAYHPTAPSPAAKAVLAGLTDSDLEFVEIYNAGLTPVNLTNWRLRGEADFDFAPAAMLGVGQALVIVSFDTADPTLELAFRTHYGIGAGVPLVGGFSGGLSNNYGRLTLQRPDEPPTNDPGLIPQVIEDEVLYDDRGAWSPSADGRGASLTRVTGARQCSHQFGSARPHPGAATLAPLLEGDYDRDGVVAESDYLVWRGTYGRSNSPSTPTAMETGRDDAADYSILAGQPRGYADAGSDARLAVSSSHDGSGTNSFAGRIRYHDQPGRRACLPGARTPQPALSCLRFHNAIDRHSRRAAK